ncbi:MAG: AAA family ATPase [Prevotella sp.]|nr:AAA family ATPase [Prevotella sp.]
MSRDEFTGLLRQAFGYTPTDDQLAAMQTFAEFMADRTERKVMILRGAAGTGKTFLASAIVKTLVRFGQKVQLMAPTGRAAKVFSLNAGQPAHTIHRKIYRQKTFAGDFNLSDNPGHNVVFFIDEASMIANDGYAESAFGSGRLLDDLVQYVYNGNHCAMLLIGDHAQLPPVGETESPALSSEWMAGYNLKVYEQTLDEVMRQVQDSGILWNATAIRNLTPGLFCVRLKGFADIHVVRGDELIDAISSSYREVGTDETMVVTRSNKRANIFNNGIRNMILDREEQLTRGDQLLVVKNKYLEPTNLSSPLPPRGGQGGLEPKGVLSFIANGDSATVVRVRNNRELYGFHFADLTLRFPDYDDTELTFTAILETLATEAPALTREQMAQLYDAVMADYAHIRNKQERLKLLKEDPYYNALQVKYGYAVTCHKAQGGQWAHVYLDQGYITPDMMNEEYFHWLYTAFTRATEQLFLVNWPDTQTER